MEKINAYSLFGVASHPVELLVERNEVGFLPNLAQHQLNWPTIGWCKPEKVKQLFDLSANATGKGARPFCRLTFC